MKFKVAGYVLRRENFTVEVEAEDEDDAHRVSRELWKSGDDEEAFEFVNDEPEHGFEPEHVTAL